METSDHDQKQFFRLIKSQRNVKQNFTAKIKYDNRTWEGEEVGEGFATYFEELARPKEDPSFDEAHRLSTELKVNLLEEIKLNDHYQSPPIIHTDENVILKAIASLKNRKAADKFSITAEHLKHASKSIAGPITSIVNKIQTSCTVPPMFKSGVVTPILKKGKIMFNPDHYRRITVTPITSKLLEKVVNPSILIPLSIKKSLMQRGFCQGSSSANAAFLLTEAIANAADNNDPLYVTMLDASKAFDVVNHAALMESLHDLDVVGNHWLLMKDWYHGMSSQVKWNGTLSRLIKEGQGLRQGGGLSAGQYVTYTNKALINLEESDLGYRIGTEYVGCPTCADDTALVHSNAIDMQIAINRCHQFSTRQRFGFSVTKTKILVYDERTKAIPDRSIWNLNKRPLEAVTKQEHLGIIRNSSNIRFSMCDERIQDGRRAAYSLFGAGFHGLNGLNPKTSVRIWKTFVVPRLIHGLEVLVYDEKQVEKIETYQRTTMKQLQHLPPCCSNSVTYLLAGITPIIAELEKRTLTTFVRFIKDKNSAEFHVIRRQLAIKDLTSKSWTTHVRKLLQKFNLPSAFELLITTPTKDKWKAIVKEAVKNFYLDILVKEAMLQSSAKYINFNTCRLTAAHNIWGTVKPSARDVTRAMVKAKLLSGTYNLEGKRALFKKAGNAGLCPLCRDAIESREHFLVICSSLDEARAPYLNSLRITLERNHSKLAVSAIFRSPKLLTRTILDPSYCVHGEESLEEAEHLTRRLVFALHVQRTALIAPALADNPVTRTSAANPADPGVPPRRGESSSKR